MSLLFAAQYCAKKKGFWTANGNELRRAGSSYWWAAKFAAQNLRRKQGGRDGAESSTSWKFFLSRAWAAEVFAFDSWLDRSNHQVSRFAMPLRRKPSVVETFWDEWSKHSLWKHYQSLAIDNWPWAARGSEHSYHERPHQWLLTRSPPISFGCNYSLVWHHSSNLNLFGTL